MDLPELLKNLLERLLNNERTGDSGEGNMYILPRNFTK